MAWVYEPDWLKMKPKLENLPRYQNEEFQYPIELIENQSEIAYRIIWIVENCVGNWNIKPSYFLFDQEDDLIAYKLRFM